MDNKIILDLDLLKVILDQEARKLTGMTMKRFELSANKEEIKVQIKELQYEWIRNLWDILSTSKVILEFNQKSKEK